MPIKRHIKYRLIATALTAATVQANEFDEQALSVTNAAMAGIWHGIEYLGDSQEGQAIELTVAISGDNGLDQSLWSREFMIQLDYAEDGTFSQQFSGEVTHLGDPQPGRWTDIQFHDDKGNWSRTATLDDTFFSTGHRQRFVMQDGVLNITAEKLQPDSEGGYQPYWTMVLERPE